MLPEHAFRVVTARPRCTTCGLIADPGDIVVADPGGFFHASCSTAVPDPGVLLGAIEGDGMITPRLRGHLRLLDPISAQARSGTT